MDDFLDGVLVFEGFDDDFGMEFILIAFSCNDLNDHKHHEAETSYK